MEVNRILLFGAPYTSIEHHVSSFHRDYFFDRKLFNCEVYRDTNLRDGYLKIWAHKTKMVCMARYH